MTTPRRRRPDTITRAEAEELIRAAVAAERERSERAMAGLLDALGGVSLKLDVVAGALAEAGHTLEVHAGLIGPMAEAFAAGVAMAEAAEGAADPSTVN